MNAQQYLREQGTNFEVLSHRATYSAQEMAAAVHVPGDEVAKTVLVKADGEYVLAVLQATRSIRLDLLAAALKANDVQLASESEFNDLFPDCELGALPPFGSQYGIRTIVDRRLTEDETIVFEGNSHHEAIRMSLADYMQLEKPQIASFSTHL